MSVEDFCNFLKSIGISQETGQKLWEGNVKSPCHLASMKKTELQNLVDDPVLLNTIHPVLNKYACPITMANDPCKKAIALLKKHAEEDMEVDPPPQDGVQSDANPPGVRHTGPTVERPAQSNTPSSTTGTRVVDTSGSSAIQADSPPTQGNTVTFNIRNGNFPQANLGGTATYNNTNTTVQAISVVESLEERRKRRDVKYEPYMIKLQNSTFATSSFYFSGNPGYWPDDETVRKVTTPTYEAESNDLNIYPVRPWNSGQALLINIYEFAVDPRKPDEIQSNYSREGAEVDTTQLQAVLEQLGFEVTTCINKKKADIEQSVREYLQRLQTKHSSMSLVFIGSHGDRLDNNDRFLSREGIRMRVSNIIDQLNGRNCPCMAGKPKLFFFQFCRLDVRPTETLRRSDRFHNKPKSDSVQSDANAEAQDNVLPHTAHSEADMIQAFATNAGTKAYRDVKEGSWFVTALCKVLKEQAHSEDLLSMMTKINNEVMANKETLTNEVAVQLSVTTSTLRKKVRFYPQ